VSQHPVCREEKVKPSVMDGRKPKGECARTSGRVKRVSHRPGASKRSLAVGGRRKKLQDSGNKKKYNYLGEKKPYGEKEDLHLSSDIESGGKRNLLSKDFPKANRGVA